MPHATHSSADSPSRRGTISGLGAILLWSTTIAMARSLSETLGPVTAGAAVYLVSGLWCAVRLLSSRERFEAIRRLPLKYLLGCGALFCINGCGVFIAVGLASDRLQAIEIGLINYLWPTLTVLLTIALLRCRIRFMLLPATILSLAGVFLVLTQGDTISPRTIMEHVAGNPAAYGAALVAALSWSAYSILTRLWAEGRPSGAMDLFLPATGVVLLLASFLMEEQPVLTGRAVAELAALGTFTFLAYSLWDYSMRLGNVILVAICSYFTPLFSTIVSCIYLQVKPGLILWIGCILLIGGSLLSWRSVRQREDSVQ